MKNVLIQMCLCVEICLHKNSNSQRSHYNHLASHLLFVANIQISSAPIESKQ